MADGTNFYNFFKGEYVPIFEQSLEQAKKRIASMLSEGLKEKVTLFTYEGEAEFTKAVQKGGIKKYKLPALGIRYSEMLHDKESTPNNHKVLYSRGIQIGTDANGNAINLHLIPILFTFECQFRAHTQNDIVHISKNYMFLRAENKVTFSFLLTDESSDGRNNRASLDFAVKFPNESITIGEVIIEDEAQMRTFTANFTVTLSTFLAKRTNVPVVNEPIEIRMVINDHTLDEI